MATMPVRLWCATLLTAAVSMGGPRVAQAQASCRPPSIDSVRARRWLDSLPNFHGDEDVDISAIGVPSARGCWTAVGLIWSAPLGGALALLRPDGSLASITPYDDIGRLAPAGLGRLAFTYRYGHGTGYGAGIVIHHFVVLCSFGTWHWAPCFEEPDLDQENTAPEWVGPDSSVGLYTTVTGDFTVLGNAVRMHRRFEWSIIYHGGTIGPAHSSDLGVSWVRLP